MTPGQIKEQAVERIYLLPGECDGETCLVWCDDPAPSEGMDASEAVEYVRKDVHDAIIARQAKAAISGMDAAKEAASSNLENAARLHAECSPEALESERAANALLTERITELEEREQALAAHVERLDNELQEKALTDDGVIADAYWNCADKITPWLGEETGPDTLINSVCESLDFLIEQWREKKTLEQERDALRSLVDQFKAATIKASMNGFGQDDAHSDDSWIDELDHTLTRTQHYDAKRRQAETQK